MRKQHRINYLVECEQGVSSYAHDRAKYYFNQVTIPRPRG